MNSNNTYVFHLSLYKKFIKLLFNEISIYDAITDKPFRIKQSEIRNIYRSSKQSKYFIELERDKESFFFANSEGINDNILKENSHLISEHTRTVTFKMTAQQMGSMILLMFLSLVFLELYDLIPMKQLYLSATCDAYCARSVDNVISELFIVLLIAFSPLALHHFQKRFNLSFGHFKLMRTNVLAGLIVFFIFAFTFSVSATSPKTHFVLKNWLQGSLNKSTIADYNAAMAKKQKLRLPANNKKTE